MTFCFSVDCNGVQCKYGSECVQGQCVCPQICPKEHAPVCASDGNTYKTKCEMRKEACRLNRDLKMVRSGSCNDDQLSGSGGNVHVVNAQFLLCFT